MSDLATLRRLRAELTARRIAEPTAIPSDGPVLADELAGDPRPDLPGSELWTRLLATAHELDGPDPAGLFGALHGLRCCGAILEARRGRWRLAPTLDPTERLSRWHDRPAWGADAAVWLAPHRDRLRRLLDTLEPPP